MGIGRVVDAWNNAMQLAVQNYVIAHAERASFWSAACMRTRVPPLASWEM